MVEEAYKASILWGIAPEQFWRMSPLEWWWQYDVRRPKGVFGNLTEDDLEDLYQHLRSKGPQYVDKRKA